MRVPITEEDLKTMLECREETGVSTTNLLKKGKVPKGLTVYMIDEWLRRRVKTAEKRYLDYVLKQWSSLPKYEFCDITEDIILEIKSQQGRTKVGPDALLKDTADKPKGLKNYTIRCWLDGTASMARKDHVDYVLNRWQSFPSAQNVQRITPGYIDITELHLSKLQKFKAKSGKGPNALMRGAKDAPEGLNSSTIKAWMSGLAKTAKPEHLSYIFKRWQVLARK